MTRLRNSRGSFRKNDFDLSIFDYRASKEGHDWQADDVPALLGIPPSVIFQRRIPAESERVVPTSQYRVPGTKFQDTVPPRETALRLGRGYAEVGGRDVADGVVVVSRVDASRELQSEFGEDMRSGPALICLSLVLKARELSLESTNPNNTFSPPSDHSA